METIRLIPHKKTEGFVVEAERPVTVEVTMIPVENGKHILSACVYEGTNVDQYTEPLGAYDSTLNNKPWSDPPEDDGKIQTVFVHPAMDGRWSSVRQSENDLEFRRVR